MDIPNQEVTNETRDTTDHSIIIKKTIRICLETPTDKDINKDLQKKETDGTQTLNPNRKETNNVDNQHKSHNQPRRKEERDSTINKIGKGETDSRQLADAIVMESRDYTYQKDKTKSKDRNSPPHESEAEDTQRTLKDKPQKLHTEVENHSM